MPDKGSLAEGQTKAHTQTHVLYSEGESTHCCRST